MCRFRERSVNGVAVSNGDMLPRVTTQTAPTTLRLALNQKIHEFLRQRRWSQRAFAKHLGVTQGSVSYQLAEKRRKSDLDYYERLAAVLGMSLSALIADLERRMAGRPQATNEALESRNLDVHDSRILALYRQANERLAAENAELHEQIRQVNKERQELLKTVLDCHARQHAREDSYVVK